MDCRTCQPSLIDLLHGELALEAAEQARAHIAHCANCKGALDKLAQGMQHARQLPLTDPPQAVTARLLQLAEEHAKVAAAARKPRGAPTVWQALLDFVGRFAAARQVGMVTIMLLIVAVGLWSLPQLKHTPIAAGGTVVHPDESGEAAPSTGVEPAEPLDLKVDLRAGRIRSREEPVAMAEPPPAPVAAAQSPASSPAAEMAEGDKVAERGLRSARGAGALDQEKAAARTSPSLGGSATARRQEGRAPGAPAPAAASPAPFPRNAKPSPDLMLSPYRAEAKGAAPAKKAEAADDAPAQSALAAAHATAASRGCNAALPEYERIVRAAPTSPDAGEALIAMARCAQQRGDAQRALELLARAQQIPHVARRASDLRARISKPAAAKGKAAPAAEAERSDDTPVTGLDP